MNAATNHRARLAVPTPVMGSLQWPSRPVFLEGNEAWGYMLEGSTSKYHLTIGHVDKIPFEVWSLSAEQPRGLGAVTKTLSADMRTRDSKWLAKKFDALSAIVGGNSINQEIFGERIVASSNSAAIAKVIEKWLEHENVPPHDGTPICDSLFPKMSTKKTMAFATPVSNPQAGDDFMLFMLEGETEDGQPIPVGVYLSGQYPPDLDGLTALLSLDMKVGDVAWSDVQSLQKT